MWSNKILGKCLNYSFFIRKVGISGQAASRTNVKSANKGGLIICKDLSAANVRLDEAFSRLSVTAQYLSGKPLLQLPSSIERIIMEKPIHSVVVEKVTPSAKTTKIIKESPDTSSTAMEDPREQIEKKAHRMLIIRRRKMNKHRRKRREKKNKVKYARKKMLKYKEREIAWREDLLNRIQKASEYEPAQEVEDYLKDYHTPYIPQTYKGRRQPQWWIKELLEQDLSREKVAESQKMSLSKPKEALILENETVEEFVKRHQQEREKYHF